MEFRPRGKSVQLVRMQRDPQTGEPKHMVIGSVKAPDFIPDETLAVKLSADEVEEVAAYAAHYRRSEQLSRDFAALKFTETLRYVHDWLLGASQAEARAFLEETRAPLTRLRRAIAKVGANDLSM